MNTKYPILLVHGVAIMEFRVFRAFGGIGKRLKRAGYTVYTSDTDGFGTVENNAAQLKAQIKRIFADTGCEKINLIAHSKGGLDSKYMIQHLGMEDAVATLTTLCTPHKGSRLASWLYGLPRPLRGFIAFWVNLWYRIFGDKHPDSLAVCRQLQATPNEELEELNVSEKVYCRSYSATMQRGRDDFLMGIPYLFMKRCENIPSDGLVSVESAKFAEYMGDCMEESLSHTEIVGFSLKKKKRERVYAFYLDLAKELSDLGF